MIDIVLRGVNFYGNISIVVGLIDFNWVFVRIVLSWFYKSCIIFFFVMYWYWLMINIVFNDFIDVSNFNKSMDFWYDVNI